jgi:hypothetical protein
MGKNKDIWWTYVKALNETCEPETCNEECSKKAMKEASIKFSDIDACVKASFDGENIAMARNVLLEAEQKELIESGIFFFPSIVINKQIYRGDFEAEAVMPFLCASFAEKPEACKYKPADVDPGKGDNNSSGDSSGDTKDPDSSSSGSKSSSGSSSDDSGVPTWLIVIIVLVGLAVLGVILYLYRRWIKREMDEEMRMQVSDAVSKYIALSESQDHGSRS